MRSSDLRSISSKLRCNSSGDAGSSSSLSGDCVLAAIPGTEDTWSAGHSCSQLDSVDAGGDISGSDGSRIFEVVGKKVLLSQPEVCTFVS